MKLNESPDAFVPRPVAMVLAIGWIVIVAKCLATPWVLEHWQVPVHPAWIIAPTLVFAALVTVIVLAHDWSRDDEED